MKLLLLLLLFMAAATVALTTAFITLGNPSASRQAATAVPVQTATLTVLAQNDAMLGQYIVLRPGPVVLTIINYARHAHMFSVPELGIEKVVLPGLPTAPITTRVRFTPPAGVFGWFCRFPCAHAMSGDIYVLQNPPRMHGPLWTGA